MNRIEEMGNKVEIEGKMKDIVEEGKDANTKMASLKEETRGCQDFGFLNIFIKGGLIGAVIAAHYASGGAVLMNISRSFVWFTIAAVCLVILVSGCYSFLQLSFIANKYDKTIEHMNIIIKVANSIEHDFRGVNNISEVLKSKHSMLISELSNYGNKYQRIVNIFFPKFLVVLLVVINLGSVLTLSLLTPPTTTTTTTPVPAVVVAPIVPPIPSIALSPPPNVSAMFPNSSAPVPMPAPAPAPTPKGSLSLGKGLSLMVVVVLLVGALYYVANGGKFEFLSMCGDSSSRF